MTVMLFASLLVSFLAACSTGQNDAAAVVPEMIMASYDVSLAEPFTLNGAVVTSDVHVFLADPQELLSSVTYFLEDAAREEAVSSGEAALPVPLPADGSVWSTADLLDGSYLLVVRGVWHDGQATETRIKFTISRSKKHPPAEPSDPVEPDEEAEPDEEEPAEPSQPEPAPPAGQDRWQPAPGTSWQWQLTGSIDTSVAAEVFDIDLFNASQGLIDELHGKGRKVICYFSAGSYEPWRQDAARIPVEARGLKMDGWDELWLDISRIDLLAPVMLARLDLAAEKGCDAVEPDNVDGYSNRSGFPLTYADQLAYNRFLAAEAHERGLSIALKNDLEQVKDLVDHFDFAINEECFTWNECEMLLPFVKAGKAVFGAEYDHPTESFCQRTNALNFDFIAKKLDLGVWRQPCR